MALVESTEIDKIEVVGPYKAVQIRKALVVKKDGVEIARSLERYSLTSGQLKGTVNADGSPAADAQDFIETNISSEPEEVRNICNTVWTQAIKDSYKAALIADLPPTS